MAKRIFLSLILLLLVAFCFVSCDENIPENEQETTDSEESLNDSQGEESSNVSQSESSTDKQTQESTAQTSGNQTSQTTETNNIVKFPTIEKITIGAAIDGVDIYNPIENTNKCYMTFELYLQNGDGTKEVLYKSDFVSPGQHITNLVLSRVLEAGEYDAFLYIQPYNMDGSLLSEFDKNIKVNLVVTASTIINSGIAIPGWGEITMPSNQTENIVVDFYNPEANEGKCYLMFELYLTNADGSKDVLYKSGLVSPGQHIQKITLAYALEKGEYEATIFVQPYKMDGTIISTQNANINTKLIVK